MSIRPAVAGDVPAIDRLLSENKLPTAGVHEALGGFVVAKDGDHVIGAVGIEDLGERLGLLRSAVVAERHRGTGVGKQLVDRVIEKARGTYDALYLLTETAENYFPNFGFTAADRASAPTPVKRSHEYSTACPSSATLMVLPLVRRVLILCTGNSARSQMAESLINWKGQGRFVAESAGIRAAERVHPLALETLEHFGVPWSGRAPRTVAGLEQQHWDLLITVCDHAKESCPIFPGKPVTAHWGMPDPTEASGDDAKRKAFREAFLVLSRRVDLLLALPLEKLDRTSTEAKVREIVRS